MKSDFLKLNSPLGLHFSAADLLELHHPMTELKKFLGSKYDTSPERVHFVGTHEEGNAWIGEFVVYCERCGHMKKDPVCEHCLELIKPTMKIEQWRGFELHSTTHLEGKNIWIDEYASEPKPKL